MFGQGEEKKERWFTSGPLFVNLKKNDGAVETDAKHATGKKWRVFRYGAKNGEGHVCFSVLSPWSHAPVSVVNSASGGGAVGSDMFGQINNGVEHVSDGLHWSSRGLVRITYVDVA